MISKGPQGSKRMHMANKDQKGSTRVNMSQQGLTRNKERWQGSTKVNYG